MYNNKPSTQPNPTQLPIPLSIKTPHGHSPDPKKATPEKPVSMHPATLKTPKKNYTGPRTPQPTPHLAPTQFMFISKPLPFDPPSQLHIPDHNGNPLSMDSAQLTVFKDPNKVSLSTVLQGLKRRRSIPKVSLGQLHGDVPHN